MTHVSTLRDAGLGYIASPYTKYPHGIETAYEDVCRLGGALLKAGVKFISPIAHGHGIGRHGDVPMLDHQVWLPFDEALMSACHYCLVAEMSGWHTSFGVGHEIAWFRNNHKPVYYLDPVRLLVRETPPAVALPDPKGAQS